MAPSRIDVHAHFLPPDYHQACLDHGHANPDGMPALPQWTEEAHLSLMHKNNISKSILSISSPGTHLVPGNDRLAASLTRHCNTYASALKKRRPQSFGYWASLPLPSIDLALAEIPLAVAEGADGFALETNHHGRYLGDALFDPVFAELSRRHATVFIHPTSPCIACAGADGDGEGQGVHPTKAAPLAANFPNPMLEFFFDTARAVANLFLSGAVERFPGITYVIPHAGGCLPPVLSRFTGFSTLVPGPWTGVSEEDVRRVFEERFYFDLAGFVFPAGKGAEAMAGSGQLVGLVQGVGVSARRLLYGSDFPFTKADGVELLAGLMDRGVKGMFNEEEIEQIYRGNAERLLRKGHEAISEE